MTAIFVRETGKRTAVELDVDSGKIGFVSSAAADVHNAHYHGIVTVCPYSVDVGDRYLQGASQSEWHSHPAACSHQI